MVHQLDTKIEFTFVEKKEKTLTLQLTYILNRVMMNNRD